MWVCLIVDGCLQLMVVVSCWFVCRRFGVANCVVCCLVFGVRLFDCCCLVRINSVGWVCWCFVFNCGLC